MCIHVFTSDRLTGEMKTQAVSFSCSCSSVERSSTKAGVSWSSKLICCSFSFHKKAKKRSMRTFFLSKENQDEATSLFYHKYFLTSSTYSDSESSMVSYSVHTVYCHPLSYIDALYIIIPWTYNGK